VRLALTSGRTRKEVADDLDIGPSTLTRRIGQCRGEEAPTDIDGDLQGELRRLREENASLKLLRLHLPMAGEGMLRILGKLPDSFAQHVLVEIQFASRPDPSPVSLPQA
jgi:transposase-like protein